MPALVKLFSKGTDVVLCQSALNGFPTKLATLAEDGIFGPKTQARVKEFQLNLKLVADGIVGPMTWGKLLTSSAAPSAIVSASLCCNGTPMVRTATSLGLTYQIAAEILRLNPSTARSRVAPVMRGRPYDDQAAKAPGIASSPPSNARGVSLAEKAILIPVFGSSINFATVVVTTATGMDGRAFVLTIPSPLLGMPAIQVVNAGAAPSNETLLHEFTHVWQSQHHHTSTVYMAAALASQLDEATLNSAAGRRVFSAYAYVPGKPFEDYNVEQIAQQVCKGETAIQTHCRSLSKNAVDLANVKSCQVHKAQSLLAAGVKT
ncbi:MAG: putative peptidoglycan-binding protein [Panacagrimonas sp.]|jgi:peptidoglycan hydrolase-like protein with peptidoglycan-binding domain|nr:peptidoglycan-binding domain-containing protein [Panacagrimonas sp.]MCC2658479.1 putative peptidoglycan-binding protein [Panacagrimonas sp.]